VVVLVTGGAGYIGSELIRELSSNPKLEGVTIRVLDNMLRERYVAIMDLPRDGRFEFLEGDIRKDDDLKIAFRDVDMVVDLAGITNAPLSFERKELTFDVNVNGNRKVVEHAVSSRVEKYVYSSTASVYGPTGGVVDEKYACKPISPYGESKLKAENACLEASRQNGLNATVLRLGTVFGYSIGMRFDTVVDRFTYLACIGMPLTVWESARTEKRPYLHVLDSVDALSFALTNRGMKGEIYNVVGENASMNRITSVISREVPDSRVIITPTPNLNQVSYELDESKIERAGFKPHHTMEEGVREIVDKFRTLLKNRSPRDVAKLVSPAAALSEA
jgi:nucleoside-diphosphate-sugar epimerase